VSPLKRKHEDVPTPPLSPTFEIVSECNFQYRSAVFKALDLTETLLRKIAMSLKETLQKAAQDRIKNSSFNEWDLSSLLYFFVDHSDKLPIKEWKCKDAKRVLRNMIEIRNTFAHSQAINERSLLFMISSAEYVWDLFGRYVNHSKICFKTECAFRKR
jgi:hypothetical protein